MHDINGFIGIVLRLKCDSEIDSEDIVYLKNWADRNRNIACELMQVEAVMI